LKRGTQIICFVGNISDISATFDRQKAVDENSLAMTHFLLFCLLIVVPLMLQIELLYIFLSFSSFFAVCQAIASVEFTTMSDGMTSSRTLGLVLTTRISPAIIPTASPTGPMRESV
jgi:hypothetical protein